MADIGRRCNSTAHYVLLEDSAELPARAMTMPHSAAITPPHDSLKKTFSSPAHSAGTAVVEEGDAVQPPPTAPLQTSAKGGILRNSVSVDGGGAAPRPKKQVSISLPGSSRPIVTARRRQTQSDDADRAATIAEEDDEEAGTSNGDIDVNDRPDQVIVEVDVHDSTDTTIDEEAVHASAVDLLNGAPPAATTEQSQEADLIHLRGRYHRGPRHGSQQHGSQRGSQRWSVRQSLTSSLSRIGNRMRGKKPPKLQRLQSTLDFDDLAQNELELKANIYWHIGTPIKRWKVEGHVPIKLVLQLLKTLCLIAQVILFTGTIAHQRAEFFFDSRIVFESLFMVDFDPEIVLQQRILYTIQDVSEELEFIATNYYRIPTALIGGYDHVRDADGEPVPIQFHLQQYREAKLNASESQYVLDGHVDDLYFNYSSSSSNSVTEQLFEISEDPHFHMFIELRVRFPVNVIRIEAPQKAECYRFNVMIVFETDNHNGKFFYYLSTDYARIDDCQGTIIQDKITYDVIKGALVALDLIVLGFCLLSLVLTAKTLRRAYRLGKAMGHFYHHRLKLPLSWWERRPLFSTWHYINILSDLLITAGTLDKILLEFEVVLDASVARILLGTALLFQAAVILRYLNYFRQVNALTRTLALAFPELVKFLLCGSVLFFAFSLCGWIVLGPFHPKFTTFNDSIESLFSLLNGDDIYNTYILLAPEVDLAAYIFSRFFLYIFLGLFVYAVLNLFTSLVISAHEISQNKDTATGNEVRRFVFSGALTPHGAALRDVTSTSKYVDPSVILNKAQKKRNDSSSDDDQ